MADTTTARRDVVRSMERAIIMNPIVSDGVTLYQGQLCALDASGELVNQTSILKCAGVIDETITGDGAKRMTVRRDVEVELIKADAAETDLMKLAYAADNQTATLTASASVLGPITKVKVGVSVTVWLRDTEPVVVA